MSSAMYPMNASNSYPTVEPRAAGGLRELMHMGHRPSLGMVRAGDIRIDQSYQRELVSARHIERICESFAWDLFFAIGVNCRVDGSIYVFDGQHRLEAVKRLFGPDEKVPALVTTGLSAQDEAKLFYAMQTTRRPVRPEERFRAQVFRAEPCALEIREIAARHGYSLIAGDEGVRIQSVSAIEDLYHPNGRRAAGLPRAESPDVYRGGSNAKPGGVPWIGRERLDWVLSMSARAWRGGDAPNARVINALSVLFEQERKMPSGIDTERLVGVIGLRSPRGWEVRENEKRARVWVLMAEEYNRGLRGKNRIPTTTIKAEDDTEDVV